MHLPEEEFVGIGRSISISAYFDNTKTILHTIRSRFCDPFHRLHISLEFWTGNRSWIHLITFMLHSALDLRFVFHKFKSIFFGKILNLGVYCKLQTIYLLSLYSCSKC